MNRQEIETPARFAACLLANDDTPRNTLDSFSDPDEVCEIAKRAWREIEGNGGFHEEGPVAGLCRKCGHACAHDRDCLDCGGDRMEPGDTLCCHCDVNGKEPDGVTHDVNALCNVCQVQHHDSCAGNPNCPCCCYTSANGSVP